MSDGHYGAKSVRTPTLQTRRTRLPQFLVIYDELILNYILALLAVAVLSVFVLGKFKIIALVCMTVVWEVRRVLALAAVLYQPQSVFRQYLTTLGSCGEDKHKTSLLKRRLRGIGWKVVKHVVMIFISERAALQNEIDSCAGRTVETRS